VFLAIVAVVFALDLQPSGIGPALVILGVFAPFVWGLGLISAGAMVTFRRGGRALGAFVTGVGIASGVYFPLSVLPDWLEKLAVGNPFAIAIEGLREALIGGAGWSVIDSDVLLLAPLAVASLVLGGIAFHAAVGRERRNGTLGLY
jgi:ABC-2 type transport system permease protein